MEVQNDHHVGFLKLFDTAIEVLDKLVGTTDHNSPMTIIAPSQHLKGAAETLHKIVIGTVGFHVYIDSMHTKKAADYWRILPRSQ